MALGAAVDCMEEAWWVVTSLGPEREPSGGRNAGRTVSPLPFMHHLDLSLPFSIMVDQTGSAFAMRPAPTWKSASACIARQKETGSAVPSWLIMDRRQREYYPWGTASPGKIPQSWLDSGYLKQADSIAALAQLCGIDARRARANGRALQ